MLQATWETSTNFDTIYIGTINESLGSLELRKIMTVCLGV